MKKDTCMKCDGLVDRQTQPWEYLYGSLFHRECSLKKEKKIVTGNNLKFCKMCGMEDIWIPDNIKGELKKILYHQDECRGTTDYNKWMNSLCSCSCPNVSCGSSFGSQYFCANCRREL